MRKLSIPLIIVVTLASLTGFFVVKVSAQCGKVKFRGTVATDEEWGVFVCYGSYWCYVIVEEILYDPNSTLSLGYAVSVCYSESLSLKVGDYVECYGCYWILGACPFQYCGYVACKEDPYYVTVISPVPVGGYSVPINKYTLLTPIAAHIALTAILTAILITIKRKTKEEQNNPRNKHKR